jgi:hypothetical protein
MDATGLADALICASKSFLGERFQLPSADALLLDLRDELRGLFFGLEVSPIAGERGDWERERMGGKGGGG